MTALGSVTMATATTKLMTAEQFYHWANRPENEDRFFELDEGRVVEVPPPSEVHGILCGYIAHLLWAYVTQRGRGSVSTNDTGLLIKRKPGTVRGPDIMLFDESKPLTKLSRKFTERIPKLIVEVLSPSDNVSAMNRRISQFLKRGVPLVWLADPETCTVTVYRPGHDLRVLQRDDELTGEDVLAKLRFKVTDLFRLPGE
jgi:Uma2 family endonuclease